MHELVRQEARAAEQQRLLEQRALGQPVVARFVVFEAEVRDVVREREQEVVARVVMRAEQRVRLRHEVLQWRDRLRLRLERNFAVGHEVQHVLGRVRRRAERNRAVVRTRCDRRIDQRLERNGRVAHAVPALLRDAQ